MKKYLFITAIICCLLPVGESTAQVKTNKLMTDRDLIEQTQQLINELGYKANRGFLTTPEYVEAFSDITRKLDWQNRSPKLAEAYRRVRAAGTVDEGALYQKRLLDILDNAVKTANRLIENAYKLKGNEAVQPAQTAIIICKSVLTFDPKNELTLNYLKEAEKAVDATAHAAPFFASEFARQSAGKILFSKNPVNPATATAKDFTTAFTSTDAIYAVAFLKNPLKDLQPANADILTDLNIDNQVAILQSLPKPSGLYNGPPPPDKSQANHTFLPLEILPDLVHLKQSRDPHAAAAYAAQINRLTPRKHIFKVSMGTEKTFLAEGSFSMDASAGTANIKLLMAEAEKRVLAANKAKAVFPKPVMHNPDVEAQIIKTKKALKVSIVSSGWEIDRDDNGAILGRYLTIYYLYKAKDGECYYNYGDFQQNYLGNGKYEQTVFQNSIGLNDEIIDCNK
jgi:hypothetical protein